MMQAKGKGKVIEIPIKGVKSLSKQHKKLSIMVIGGSALKKKAIEPTPKPGHPPLKKKRWTHSRSILFVDSDDDENILISQIIPPIPPSKQVTITKGEVKIIIIQDGQSSPASPMIQQVTQEALGADTHEGGDGSDVVVNTMIRNIPKDDTIEQFSIKEKGVVEKDGMGDVVAKDPTKMQVGNAKKTNSNPIDKALGTSIIGDGGDGNRGDVVEVDVITGDDQAPS